MGDFVVDFSVWLAKFITCSFVAVAVARTVVKRAKINKSKDNAGSELTSE